MGRRHRIVWVLRLMTRSISETPVVIIGPLGMVERLILRKLGHRIGKIVATEAATPSGKFDPKLRSMEVIRGGRSMGMKEAKVSATPFNLRDFRFGSQGSLNARNCSTERNSEGREHKPPSYSSLRILCAYPWNRAYSCFVWSPLKGYRNEGLSE